MNFALNKPSFKKSIVSLIVAAFTVFIMDVSSQAQSVPSLPSPGTMLTPSASYSPVIIKGITIFPDNPFQFDFIIDDGDDHLQNGAFEKEAIKLVKYFMVSLTMPEDEMWVNLSPYEGDRMIPEKLGYTEIGQNLLEQDYLLKQLTASMMYPETELGSQFWQTVYKKIEDKYGTTDIPMNTFNKVWIIPDKADVYVEENTVYVVNSHLKVLLEEDYLSLESNIGNTKHGMSDSSKDELKKVSEVSSEAIKDVLIPEVEKEVNTGKTFANLRQIYNSLILAAWYKKNLKDSLLSQAYSDKQKIKGVNTENNDLTQQIYNQYLKAFEKGVYDYIREDIDNVSQEVIPRKYFSGGIDNEGITDKVDEVTIKDPLKIKTSELLDTKTVRVILKAFPQLPEPPSDNAMLGEQYSRNQSEFDWKSEKTGIKNILETIKLHNRYIYSEYQEYLRSDINNFSEERLLSLKNEIYSITTMHFGIWGIGTALDSRSAPYFHGNIITALTKTFAELDLNPYAIKYQFITEEDGIKSVKAALERFKPEIWKKYLAYKSAPEDFGKEALQRLKDQIYDIQKANFDIWGLSAVLKASEYPYFNGSYISALQKALPELDLNYYAFSYKFTTENEGINSIHAALERFAPEIWGEYQDYIRDMSNFSPTRVEKLRSSIYAIKSSHFLKWHLNAALSRMKAPYFEGSYKTALIKSLAHLNLKFDRFNKLSNKIVYRWTFGIEQGISNIRTAIADNRPDIWKEYLALINDNKNFDKKRTRELKESFYSISSADFVSWGLGASLSLKSAPYFEGSYIKAVTDSFKELDLNPYAFSYKLDSEENGIKSVQAALERYESDLWEEYQSYLKNPSAFDTKRLKNLKNRIYNIQSAHFLIWGFGEYTFSDEHPYFKHSYITALQKSFSELDLNSYAFAYKYGTKEDAMNSIQAALERYEPELWNEYNQFVSDPDAFTKEELNNLKDRIYNLTSYHFELWGLTEVLRNPYFGNSYVTALQSAFNQIELNPYAFVYKFTAEEDGIKSFHAALQRYEPQLWEEYINFAKNPKNFDEEQINLLKDKFRQINKPRIEEWHLGGALSKKTAPYFGGTYRIALQKSFPEIFSSQFSRSKDAAMLSSQGSNITEHPGGIDLNPDILDLREHGVKIRSSYFSNLNFNQFKEVQGFVPVIINISTPTGLVSPHF